MDQRRYEGLCGGLGVQADFMMIPMEKAGRIRYYQQHIAQLRGYSAIFAVSDYYAVDLIHFLQSSGVKVPDDVSVIGFDGSAICEQVVPSLTSVQQDYRARAQMAVSLLKRMREQPDYTEDITIPVKLVVRNSSRRLCH